MSQRAQVVPGGLEDLIKTGISAAFPESSNAPGLIKITPSKITSVDYQFHIRALVICLRKDPDEIIVNISETIPDNDIIERLEISENNSYVNIFTKVSRPKPCKTCSNNTTLGRQEFSTQPAELNLREKLIKELSQRMLNSQPTLAEKLKQLFLSMFKSQPVTKDRKTTTIAEKVLQNFELILGGGQVIDDVMKAVESIGDRDYPQLNHESNHEKVPAIFTPNIFLTQHPEAFDYKICIQELQKLKETINETKARELKKDQRSRSLTKEELDLVEKLKKVDNLKHIIGEQAEKKVYNFLKECILDEECVVINNLKIMTLKDLDDIAEDFEKDFVILNLTRRFIMSLEVKANCNEDSLRSAKKQTNACKESISKWVQGVLTEEKGWAFYTAVYFQHHKPEKYSFCNACSKYIIFAEEFREKFDKIITEMPAPPFGTEESARAEFKKIAKLLLFLASYEPVVTQARITDKLVQIIEEAGNLENIVIWNQIFCLTPNQLSLIRTMTIERLLLLSQPSSGKTFILKAKAKKLALNGQKVLFVLPCWRNVQSLLFFQLQQEFKEFSESIKVDNVKANFQLLIDENDLMAKLKKYKNHHIIMDEVAVYNKNDIAVIKKAAQKCTSKTFWLSITDIFNKQCEEDLRWKISGFCILSFCQNEWI